MLPNGIIGHLFGPWGEHNADSFLLKTSKLLETCAEHAVRDGTDENTPAEEWFLQLFGDPAYGVSNQIITLSRDMGNGQMQRRTGMQKWLQCRLKWNMVSVLFLSLGHF